jgi:transcriptional regulator with XRE-family HTH domain
VAGAWPCLTASIEGVRMVAQLPAGHLATKLDRLFRSAAARRRGEFTYREVAAGVERAGFAPISATYIWQLRTGQRGNPTMRHLEGLASYFGVPVSYFFDERVAARVDADLDLVVTLADGPLRQLALGAAGLSDDSRAAVLALIRHLRRLEAVPGLPEPAGEDVGGREPAGDAPLPRRSRKPSG